MIGNKKIEFVANKKDMLDVWPHPKPASRFIPEEYKNLPRFTNNNPVLPNFISGWSLIIYILSPSLLQILLFQV